MREIDEKNGFSKNDLMENINQAKICSKNFIIQKVIQTSQAIQIIYTSLKTNPILAIINGSWIN